MMEEQIITTKNNDTFWVSPKLYYREAAKALSTYKFDNDTHKKIWALHSEGCSFRQIADAIVDCNPTYKRTMVGIIIRQIAEDIFGKRPKYRGIKKDIALSDSINNIQSFGAYLWKYKLEFLIEFVILYLFTAALRYLMRGSI